MDRNFIEFCGKSALITGSSRSFGRMKPESSNDLIKVSKLDDRATTRTPMCRKVRPEKIAGPAIYLAPDASNSFNGQLIFVDGGPGSVQ